MISAKNKEPGRGEIYWVNLDPAIGSEICKTRPAMVISNNIQNKVSGRIVVIPITSNANNIYPFETKIILEKKSAKVLTDQIRTIDKSRLGDRICKLTKSEINEIEKAIKVTLSLE